MGVLIKANRIKAENQISCLNVTLLVKYNKGEISIKIFQKRLWKVLTFHAHFDCGK